MKKIGYHIYAWQSFFQEYLVRAMNPAFWI